MSALEKGKLERSLFVMVMASSLIAVFASLAAFVYLGSFTRYLADDYCEAVHAQEGSGLGAVIHRYTAGQLRSSGRYSNLLFVGITQSLGSYSPRIISIVMASLWIAGLVWLSHEIRKMARLEGPLAADYLVGGLLAFFALLQAPNRFQILYWRSGMATHFAPLVFLSLLSAFLLRRIRLSGRPAPSLWLAASIFVASFFTAGFSEPPVAFMIVALGFAIFILWRWVPPSGKKQFALILLASCLAGAVLALVVMFFAPGNLSQVVPSAPGLPSLIERTLRYTIDFLIDSLKILPLPTAISFLASAVFFFGLSSAYRPERPELIHKRVLWVLVVAIPVALFIFIAASFAPSAFGQSYPVARARFLARFLMTAALMLEGALFGILASRLDFSFARLFPASAAAALMLLVFALYPLRVAWLTLSVDVPQYSQWAAAWDARDAQIRADRAAGLADITVSSLHDFYGVSELRDDPTSWINRCAARFYAVDSISALR